MLGCVLSRGSQQGSLLSVRKGSAGDRVVLEHKASVAIDRCSLCLDTGARGIHENERRKISSKKL